MTTIPETKPEGCHCGDPTCPHAQGLDLDVRPVDLNAVITLLGTEIDECGETGIWGDYGPPAAPLHYLIRLLHENADAIENQTGIYAEEPY